MDLQRELAGKELTRFEPAQFAAQEDERTVEFSFSSETPVKRWFGNEVLSHDSKAVDLARMQDGAPVLFNHDPDRVIGVVERAWIDGEKRRARALVRFSRNSFAEEVLADVRDGILRNISVGYSIDTAEERDDNIVITRWQPHELSVVAIPADPSIGIGRSLTTEVAVTAATPPVPSPTTMEDNTPNLEEVRALAAAEERSRVASITALCREHNVDLSQSLIESGASKEAAMTQVLVEIGKRAKQPAQVATPVAPAAQPISGNSSIDMNQRDAGRYSITAGIRASLTGDWSTYEAGLAREMSTEVAKSMGRSPSAERAFFVPFSALTRATYVTSGATTGGNLVATDLLDQDFIEFLRNRSVMIAAGVSVMTGLQGNVAIPRRSGVSSTYYLSTQSTAITQSESTFDQVTMTPKNLAALSKYSRQTLLQATPGIEQLVRNDLVDGINVAMDLGILNGTGSSGQPTGIMQTSGIGSVAIGTNGGAITMETLVNLETELTIDNVPVDRSSINYITNAKVMGALKKLRAGGSTTTDGPFLVNDNLVAIGRGGTPSVINGYPVYVTNQVPSNLTKGSSSGVCSAVLIGDFSQATVGMWGNGLEITVGEDQDDFSKALTSVRGIVSYDVGVREPKAFATVLDVTTA
jgi:HK97 family phage major capsid protein/HK97 family phage prohead protease